MHCSAHEPTALVSRDVLQRIVDCEYRPGDKLVGARPPLQPAAADVKHILSPVKVRRLRGKQQDENTSGSHGGQSHFIMNASFVQHKHTSIRLLIPRPPGLYRVHMRQNKVCHKQKKVNSGLPRGRTIYKSIKQTIECHSRKRSNAIATKKLFRTPADDAT